MGCRVSAYRDPEAPAKASQVKKSDPVSKTQVFGSKEEIFFDSRGWLESDCEEDFFSVNGELTPSHGGSPNHQTSTSSTSQLNEAFDAGKLPLSRSKPSPNSTKKLAIFLQETLRDDQASSEQGAAYVKEEANGKPDANHIGSNQTPKSSNGTTNYPRANSVRSSEVTQKTEPRYLKEKRGIVMKCCMPSLT